MYTHAREMDRQTDRDTERSVSVHCFMRLGTGLYHIMLARNKEPLIIFKKYSLRS